MSIIKKNYQFTELGQMSMRALTEVRDHHENLLAEKERARLRMIAQIMYLQSMISEGEKTHG